MKLKAAEKTLAQVNVTAYRQIARNDAEKSVYKIDPSGFLKTSKADEALNFLPGVEAENGVYTLLGRDRRARLKINGQTVGLDEVKALRISDIENVEVREITKDDNGQFAGEINIVKKRREQPMINYSLSAWTGSLRKNLGTYDNFNFQNKRWDVSAHVNVMTAKQDNTTRIYRDRYAANGDVTREMEQNDVEYRSWQESEGLRASWIASKRLTLNMAFSHSVYGGKAYQHIKDNSNNTYFISSKDRTENYYTYANAKYEINPKNRLVLKTAYNYYRTPYTFSTHPELNYKSSMRAYTAEIGSEHRMKILGGTHDITTAFRNTTRQNITSSTGTATYSVQQLSVTDMHAFSKQLSYYLILKGETDNQGARRFTSFQPQLRINYNMAKRGSLSATYERRVMRPSIKFLNPDTLSVNILERVVGNENLEAMYSDTFIFTFRKQVKKSYFTSTLNLNRTGKMIDRIYLDDTDYDVTTYANIGNSRSATLSANFTHRLFKNRMNLSLTASGFYKKYDIAPQFERDALVIPSAGWGWNATVNMSYLSSKRWIYSLQCTYKPRQYALAEVIHKNPALNGTIRKGILNDKLVFTVNFMCPFVYCVSERSEYNLRNLKQRKDLKMRYNNVTLNVTLNIGKWFRHRTVTSDATGDDITL